MGYGQKARKPLYLEHAAAFDEADGSGIVTNLKAMPTDPSRVKVYVDRVKVCRVSAQDCLTLGLAKGVEWTSDLAHRVRIASAAHEAEKAGVSMLATRGRSEKLIQQRLRQRGHAPEGIREGLARLREKGFVDDAAYAAQTVRSELRRKPAGKRLLEMKLRQAGVSDQITRAAIDEGFEGHSEHEDALQLARKQSGTLTRLEPEVALRRLVGRLARRGFSGSLSYEVAKKALAEAAAEQGATEE